MVLNRSTRVRLSLKQLQTMPSITAMLVDWRSVQRRLHVVFLVVFAAMVSGCWRMSDRIEALVGKSAPDASLLMLDGPETSISAEHGRFIGLIFWATWCSYSKSAMDDIEELANKYRGRDDVRLFAVSIDRYQDLDVLKSRIASQKLHSLRHVFSGSDIDDEAYQRFNGEAIPYVVLIDPRGVVRYVGNDVSGAEEILDARFGQ